MRLFEVAKNLRSHPLISALWLTAAIFVAGTIWALTSSPSSSSADNQSKEFLGTTTSSTIATTTSSSLSTNSAVTSFPRSWNITAVSWDPVKGQPLGGYSESSTFSVADAIVYDASQPPKVNGITVGSACTMNSQFDEVVPFTWTISNTTPSSLSAPLGLRMILGAADSYNFQSPGKFQIEAYYSSGPQCLDFTSPNNYTFSLSASDRVSPGGGITLTGFIIDHNAVTPDQPNGERSWLLKGNSLQWWESPDSIWLYPQHISGPGAIDSGLRMFNLLGTAPANYSSS